MQQPQPQPQLELEHQTDEYYYYQTPLQATVGEGYHPEAMQHTYVLTPGTAQSLHNHTASAATLEMSTPPPTGYDSDNYKDQDTQERDQKWWNRWVWIGVLITLIVIVTASTLTGVYLSKASSDSASQKQASNSPVNAIPNQSGIATASLSRTAGTADTATATVTATVSNTLATTTTGSSSSTSTASAETPSPAPSAQGTGVNQPTTGLPKDVGNCQSGSFPFTTSRTATSGYNGTVDPSLKVQAYDFILPYNAGNVQMDGSLHINLLKNEGSAATGATLTTSRYMYYGKFSVFIKAINVGGAITDVITLSDQGDEVDIEICGAPVAPYTNVFYDTVGKSDAQKEYFTHYDIINGIDMGVGHTYTVDWKHESLTWLVDGRVVRTLKKSESVSSMNPGGAKWFPVTPSLIQFGVWDASYAADPRTVQWAGGPIKWGGNSQYSATYSDFSVQCYDPMDNPVAHWP